MKSDLISKKYTGLLGGVVLLILSLIALDWAYQIISPVFNPLLFAAVFAVVFYPIYEFFVRKTKSEVLSSLLTSFILVIVVLALLSFVIYLAVGEVVSITKVLTNNFDFQSLSYLQDQAKFQELVDQTITTLNSFLGNIPFLNTSISDIVTQILRSIPPLLQELSSGIINVFRIGLGSAGSGIASLIIFFVSFYFLLMDGKKFVEYTFQLLPIHALHERQITKRFSSLCFAWIVVSFLLAFIQGTFATIGFAIIGVPSPFIWGIVSMVASFIPFIGAAIIWASIGVIYLILGYYGQGIFILIWGALLISSSDNLLRPFLLKEGVKIHPFILFIAVFGGFFAFKVPGLIIGPLIMVFISTLLYIYQLEFGDELARIHDGDHHE